MQLRLDTRAEREGLCLAQQLFVYSSKLFVAPHDFFREHTSVIALHGTFITSPSS